MEDGSVDDEPYCPLLYGRDDENCVPVLDLLSLI